MAQTVRAPKQTRSVETKKKIIRASYELFAEVGYYNTNTAEIAKKANVSTGIVYGYFRNKGEILLEILDLYMEDVYAPILNLVKNANLSDNLEAFANQAIDMAIDTHKRNAHIHEALHSMRHTDEKVNERFIELEDDITQKIAEILPKLGVNVDDVMERVHLCINEVQSFAHEYVYDRHRYINYDHMRNLVVKSLIGYLS